MMAESGLSSSIKATNQKEESSWYDGYFTERMFDAAMINMTESNSYEEVDTDEDEYGYKERKEENKLKNVTSEGKKAIADEEQLSSCQNLEKGLEEDACTLRIDDESERMEQVKEPEKNIPMNPVKIEHPIATELESTKTSDEKVTNIQITTLEPSISIKEEVIDECDVTDHHNSSISEELESDLMEKVEGDIMEEKKYSCHEKEQVVNMASASKQCSSSSSFLLEMLKQPVVNSTKANALSYEKDLPSFASVPSVREKYTSKSVTDYRKGKTTHMNGTSHVPQISAESGAEFVVFNGNKNLQTKPAASSKVEKVSLGMCELPESKEQKIADDKTCTSEIDELLQLSVPKDYVNCVWSNEAETGEPAEVISTSTPCAAKDSDGINSLNCSSESMIEAVEEDVGSGDVQPLLSSSQNTQLVSNTLLSDVSSKLPHVSQKDKGKSVHHVEAEKGTQSSILKKPHPKPHINVLNGDRVKSVPKGRLTVWPKASQKGKSKRRGMIQIESIRSLASDTTLQSNDQMVIEEANELSAGSKTPLLVRSTEETNDLSAGSKTPLSTVRTVQPIETSYVAKTKQMNNSPFMQAAYRKLVLNHVLPPYSPKNIDSKHWNGLFHTCTACGDKFVLESSLQNHLSRRSAVFIYMCPECSSRHFFYNRCTLLQHHMMHGLKAELIDAAHLIVSPLPDAGREIGSLGMAVCAECKKEVISLPSHMEGKDVPKKSGPSTTCSICNQILPSTCALNAHDRIHKQKTPYVCPECGLKFIIWEALEKHIKDTCLHVNRKTTYQCLACSVFYFSTQKLTEHITVKHFKEIFKCDACYIACFSVESLGIHRKNHKELPVLESDELQKHVEKCGYYTCQLCPNQLIRRDSKLQHAVSHAKDVKVMASIYQCEKCDKIFSTKELLLEHNHRCRTFINKRHRESVTNQSHQLIPAASEALISETVGVSEVCSQTQHEVSALSRGSPLSLRSIPTVLEGYYGGNETVSTVPLIRDTSPDDAEMNIVEEKVVEPDGKTELPQTNGPVDTDRHCVMCNVLLDSGKGSNINPQSFLANYCLLCWNTLRMRKAELMKSNSETMEEVAKTKLEKKQDKTVSKKKDKPSDCKEKRQSGQIEEKSSQDLKLGERNLADSKTKRKLEPGTESYICKLCKRLISKDCDKTAIKNHFIEEHRDIFLKALQTGQSAATGSDKKVSYKLPIQKLIVDNPSGLPKNIPFRKSLSPKKRKPQPVGEETESMDSENCGVSSPGQSPSKKARRRSSTLSDTSPLRVGQTLLMSEDQTNARSNVCYKCGFSSESPETFRDHIVLHKADPASLQCPVCGMCFIVRPPLEKHLLVHHRIKNVKEYLQSYGFEEPNTEEDTSQKTEPEAEDTIEVNQCKVCRERFENTLLLEKHFRVHGGAFLLANQKARKSLE